MRLPDEIKLKVMAEWIRKAEARKAVFRFIEGWYNPSHRHSGVDYLSPLNYERRYKRSLGTESRNLSPKAG